MRHVKRFKVESDYANIEYYDYYYCKSLKICFPTGGCS